MRDCVVRADSYSRCHRHFQVFCQPVDMALEAGFVRSGEGIAKSESFADVCVAVDIMNGFRIESCLNTLWCRLLDTLHSWRRIRSRA